MSDCTCEKQDGSGGCVSVLTKEQKEGLRELMQYAVDERQSVQPEWVDAKDIIFLLNENDELASEVEHKSIVAQEWFERGRAAEARIAKLEALNAMMIQALKRGCSCRPGGSTCPCCLALDHADGKEWG